MPGPARRPDQPDSSRSFKRKTETPKESTPAAKPPVWQPSSEGNLSGLMALNPEQRAEAVRDLQRRYGNQRVQRMLARLVEPQEQLGDSNQVPDDVANRIDKQIGSGRPLDEATRGEMGDTFGYDFSEVKIHTGSEADSLNRDVQAQAFTTGQDIFFKGGNYSPGSDSGKELLAHELTHVVQQGTAPAPTSGPATVTSPSDASEIEAAEKAQSVVQQGDVARQPEEEEELQMARQAEDEEEELQMARQAEDEEDELQMARQVEEEEEVMMTRQATSGEPGITVARGILDTIGKGIAGVAQKLGFQMGTKSSKFVLEKAFDGKKFDTSNVFVVNEAGIIKAWDAIYGEGSYEGTGDFADAAPDGPLEGFTAPDDKIYINKDAQAVDTVPHEVLHRHENGVVINQMGERFNEGFTEYLTQKAVSGAGFEPTSSYPDELAVTKKLAAIVGDAKIEAAYFDGDLDGVKDTLDADKGAGTFDEVVDAMKDEDYGRANITIQNGIPAPVPAPVPAP